MRGRRFPSRVFSVGRTISRTKQRRCFAPIQRRDANDRAWTHRWEARFAGNEIIELGKQGLIDDNDIEQAIYNITGKNDLFYRYIGSRILRDLNYGARIKGFGGINYSTESFFAQRMKFQPYTKKDVIDDLKIINDKNNKYC